MLYLRGPHPEERRPSGAYTAALTMEPSTYHEALVAQAVLEAGGSFCFRVAVLRAHPARRLVVCVLFWVVEATQTHDRLRSCALGGAESGCYVVLPGGSLLGNRCFL